MNRAMAPTTTAAKEPETTFPTAALEEELGVADAVLVPLTAAVPEGVALAVESVVVAESVAEPVEVERVVEAVPV